MDPGAYRKLVDILSDEPQWLPALGFAGLSSGLRHFVDGWRKAADRLCIPPSATSKAAIIVLRPGGFDRLSDDLLKVAGIDPAARVKLYAGAIVYNATRLFGSAARPGVLENPATGVLVLDGVEHLDQALSQRLLRHLGAWWVASHANASPYHIIFLLNDDGAPALRHDLGELLGAEELQLPRLRGRLEDIPFCLHSEARVCGGALNDIDPDALQFLLEYSWPGDLGELYALVRRLYYPPSDRARRFSQTHVSDALRATTVACSSGAIINPGDWPLQWVDLDGLYKQCNRRANALINGPFFATGTAEAAADPAWNSQCPELVFLQLVSWAYRKLVEEADPNMRIVLDIHEQVYHGNDQAKRTCETLVTLRTYEQHRLEYGSPHDAETRIAVEDWFRKACGDGVPEPWQVEACITAILHDLRRLFLTILDVLRRIENDALRSILVDQWKQRRETSWPKHRFVTLVADVVRLLGRLEGPNTLVPEPLTEKLLKRMQDQLRVIAEDSDREQKLRTWIEKVIQVEYPETMPVSTKDLERLGLPPGPAYKEIMRSLQADYDSKKSSRETLLELAKQLVHALAKD
jgi:hypothetical protein